MVSRVQYHGIHHVSVLVADTEKSLAFYVDVLGMSVDLSRPPMSYRGAWLNVTPGPRSQQIHLIELPNPDPVEGRPAHGGHDRHCALHIGKPRQRLTRVSWIWAHERSCQGTDMRSIKRLLS